MFHPRSALANVQITTHVHLIQRTVLDAGVYPVAGICLSNSKHVITLA
jgi:hypothetical protein